MKLEGKVAIVTGTSPNIGGGIAGGLADEGASVVCVDVVPDNAHQCADQIILLLFHVSICLLGTGRVRGCSDDWGYAGLPAIAEAYHARAVPASSIQW